MDSQSTLHVIDPSRPYAQVQWPRVFLSSRKMCAPEGQNGAGFSYFGLDLRVSRSLLDLPNSRPVSESMIRQARKEMEKWLVPGLISAKQFRQSPNSTRPKFNIVATTVEPINLFIESFCALHLRNTH